MIDVVKDAFYQEMYDALASRDMNKIDECLAMMQTENDAMENLMSMVREKFSCSCKIGCSPDYGIIAIETERIPGIDDFIYNYGDVFLKKCIICINYIN